MLRTLGILLSAIFVVLSFFHLYWAAGGKFGSLAAVPTRDGDGERLFNPSATGTILVAAALLLAALIVLGRLGIAGNNMPKWFFYRGTQIISLLFLLRAIGDFGYIGFFKRVTDTGFAIWDTWLFSPLCLFVAVSALLLAFAKD